MHTYQMMCQKFKLQFRDSTAILCIKQLFSPGAAIKSILMSWVRRGPNKPSCCFDFKPVCQSFRCFDVSFFFLILILFSQVELFHGLEDSLLARGILQP